MPFYRQVWLNRDPIGEEGGLNVYAFVHNAPINFYDAHGEQAVRPGLPPPRPGLPGRPGAPGRPRPGYPRRPVPVIPPLLPPSTPEFRNPPGLRCPAPKRPERPWINPEDYNPKPWPPVNPPKLEDKPECDFYKAWCEWGNKEGFRPPDDPGRYWTENADCDACYRECKRTGAWPMDKCKMGGPNGPRWDPNRPNVWPD